jgi:hypothetical protein
VVVVGALAAGIGRMPKAVFGRRPNSFGNCGSMARAVFSYAANSSSGVLK